MMILLFLQYQLDDEGSNLSIWCDYEGPTVSFTDFSNIDDENSYADAGLSEEFVREKLENLGVVIPENAVLHQSRNMMQETIGLQTMEKFLTMACIIRER